MDSVIYDIVFKPEYVDDSQETCMRLYHCAPEEVTLLRDVIIGNHSGYMMEIYQHDDSAE